MPKKIGISKLYTFNCGVPGDFVKIVTGQNNTNKNLKLAKVEVYKRNKYRFKFDRQLEVFESDSFPEQIRALMNEKIIRMMKHKVADIGAETESD